MSPRSSMPFSYHKQSWEENPKWLLDAYKRAALSQDGGSLDPQRLERFVRNIAKLDDLIDPQKIALFNGPSGKLLSPHFEAEEVVQPFEKLIEAVTEEVLQLVRVMGDEYVGSKTADNIQIFNTITKGWADPNPGFGDTARAEYRVLKEIRQQLRNNVAAIMFKSIRDFALADHLRREHHISDADHRQIVGVIAERLDKTGINGLERFIQANPGIKNKLETDESLFVPEQYKVKYKETGEISEWYPNDREQRKIKRGEFYKWHLEELERNRDSKGNDPNLSWNYDDELLTAQYRAVGPDYCHAVKNRNKVMGGYELEKDWQRAERVENVEIVNNLLGSLDPRAQEFVGKTQVGAVSDPLSSRLPPPPREPENDPSKLLSGGDAAKTRKKSLIRRGIDLLRRKETGQGFVEREGNRPDEEHRWR